MHNLAAPIQVVLAGMLSLLPPGKSMYSRTTLDFCDTECQAKKVCELPSILCLPPQYNQELQKYTRSESYEEGLKRYAVIAEAIVEASSQIAWSSSSEECIAKCSKGEYGEECKKCWKARPWMGSSKELQAAIAVVMLGESGYRQDIHSGVGALAKGDCEWRDQTTHLKTSPFARNSSPVQGTCKSYCLAQINLGSPSGTKYGYTAQDLVGTDLESTKRCALAAAKALASARKLCSGPLSDYTGDWAKGMFSSYGSGNSCKVLTGTAGTLKEATWPAERATLFRNFLKNSLQLTDAQKTILGMQLSSVVVSSM